MANNRAQFLWIGTHLSLIERLALKSFLDYGWEVHLYRYDPIDNVPDGVRILDGDDILPREELKADTFQGIGGGIHDVCGSVPLAPSGEARRLVV